MSFGESGEKLRAVVPRWRSLTNTPSVETDPTPNFSDIQPTTADEFSDLLGIWRRNRRAIDAVDILDAGIATGSRRLIVEGANRVLSHAKELRPEVVDRAHRFLGSGKSMVVRPSQLALEEGSRDEVFQKIRGLKAAISESPRSSLLRVEIARLYARLGQFSEAEHHLRIAIAHSPNDRFTLRAITRFYTMLDLPDEALVSLWKAPALNSDPWLMSAELAAATLSKRTTKKAHKLGRRLHLKKGIPRQLSELATGWITRETLRGANDKKTIRTLQHTLVDPTENALAQGIWLTDRLGRDFIDTFPTIQLPPEAHEARALSFVEQSRFTEAEYEAALWVADQPFQLRSFWLLAFIRFLHLYDYEGVVRVVRHGMSLHPHDWMMLNYGVLGSALSGDLVSAAEFLDKFERALKDKEGQAYLLAAKGLMRFEAGDEPAGVDLYIECLRTCRQIKRPDLAVNAAVFLIESLVRHGRIGVEDVRSVESKIERAVRDLTATEQRDMGRIYRSRKRVWDSLLEQGSAIDPAPARFNAATLEQELLSIEP